jgi:ATP-binding cassette subfamily B protein
MLKEYRTLFPYLGKYRWQYAAGIFADIAVDGGNILMPQFIKHAIDTVAADSVDFAKLVRILLGMVLLAAAVTAGRFLWRFFIHGSSRRIETEMRDRLFSRLMDFSSDYFQKNKTGDLMARATNDMGAIRQATGMGFITFIDGVFMSAGILAVMIASAPRTALLTIIPLPLVTILIIFFGTMVGRRFQKVQEIYSKLSEIAQETMAGIRVVKAFVKENHFAEKFSEANDEYRDSSLSLARIFGFFFPFIGFLSGLTTFILLLAGGAAVVENRMSPGEIVAMLAYLEMLIWPMMGAGFTVNTLQRGAASLKRVNEVLYAEPTIKSPPRAHTDSPRGEIEVRGLTFTYEGAAAPALSDVSLNLSRGLTLGILGRVGSGKSTLLKTLPRLLDPLPGAVFIGGNDVRDYELHALRQAFGYVPQDSFLFSDSVAANVRFAEPGLSAERFALVTAISTIDRDVAGFPQGWETVVGEKGLTLSGGQKQRVALSRALAADPEILVLDDALSAVDAETEERILSSLLEERRGKTNVIVSHRVSTLRTADFIIVLDDGRVVQRGSHLELLAEEDGFYAEIARLQELEAEARIFANEGIVGIGGLRSPSETEDAL